MPFVVGLVVGLFARGWATVAVVCLFAPIFRISDAVKYVRTQRSLRDTSPDVVDGMVQAGLVRSREDFEKAARGSSAPAIASLMVNAYVVAFVVAAVVLVVRRLLGA